MSFDVFIFYENVKRKEEKKEERGQRNQRQI